MCVRTYMHRSSKLARVVVESLGNDFRVWLWYYLVDFDDSKLRLARVVFPRGL